MDTIPSPWNCLKTCLRNFLTAAFTNTITSPRNALQSAIDFLEHAAAKVSRACSQILFRCFDGKLNCIRALNICGPRFTSASNSLRFFSNNVRNGSFRVLTIVGMDSYSFYTLIPALSSHSSLQMIEGAIRLRHLNNLLQKKQEIYLL